MTALRVLGIETSCDETGVAIYDGDHGLLTHEVYTQIIHSQHGGVVPELASRDHIRKLLPMIERVMANANTNPSQIDAIAYTAGPGLIGALLVGASVSQGLGFAWQIPTLGVHHMEAHLLAPMLEADKPAFPFIALLVSGGHTLLVKVDGVGQYQLLGETLDDACGEAFDKTAKILGLGYPGGARLAKLAQTGDRSRFHFPRPMTDRPGLDFSFSGLKTFALNTVNREPKLDQQTKADIAYAFEDAVVDTLTIKCKRALQQTGIKCLVVAGGVSANLALRQRLDDLGKRLSATMYFPGFEFCADNGAMVAYCGYQRLQGGEHDNLGIQVKPRWPLDELSRVHT